MKAAIVWVFMFLCLVSTSYAAVIGTGTTINPPDSNVTYYFNTDVTADYIHVNNTCLEIINSSYAGVYCYYGSTNVTYNITDFNGIIINFYDSDTETALNTINISLQVIGDTPSLSYTTNGSITLTQLKPDSYTLLYTSDGYKQGKYVVHLFNNTISNISLYLQDTNNSNLVLLNVKDRFGNVLQDVEIIIQKWSTDSWITDQIVVSDFKGQAEAYYVLSENYYNHVLKYNDIIYFGAINGDEEKKIIYTEDAANGITFNIDILGQNVLGDYYDSREPTTNLSFINITGSIGYFRYFWTHSEAVKGCLNIRAGQTRQEIYSQCSTTSTGTIVYTINTTQHTYFSAKGSIDGFVTDDLIQDLSVNDYANWGSLGYLLGFFAVVTSIFIFIASPTIGILVGTGVFIGLVLMGVMFQDLGFAALIALGAVSYIVATIKSDSGVNS
jgi:hypothetical protein